MMITSNLFFSCQFGTNQWPSHHQKPCKKLGDVMGPYLDSWIRGKKKGSTKTKLCPNFCCGRDQTGPIFFGGHQTIRMYGNLRDFAYDNGILWVGCPTSWPLCWLDRFVILQDKIEHVQGKFSGLQLDCWNMNFIWPDWSVRILDQYYFTLPGKSYWWQQDFGISKH